MVRFLSYLLPGLVVVSFAHAEQPRNNGQVVSDCAHQANQRDLKGQARQDFLDWCSANAARSDNRDVNKHYDRYDSCADAAGRQGYKGDDRQRYMDWCVD